MTERTRISQGRKRAKIEVIGNEEYYSLHSCEKGILLCETPISKKGKVILSEVPDCTIRNCVFVKVLMKRLCVVAEANPFITRLLQRFAEKRGLDVLLVQVGQDVLELVRQKKPAVIVIDPELPGKVRGWEVIRLLREDAQTRQIPVIACTWMDEAGLREMAGEVSGRLQKPEIHYKDFVAKLRKAGVYEMKQSVPE
jgi:CheY-like chemotaxis protein